MNNYKKMNQTIDLYSIEPVYIQNNPCKKGKISMYSDPTSSAAASDSYDQEEKQDAIRDLTDAAESRKATQQPSNAETYSAAQTEAVETETSAVSTMSISKDNLELLGTYVGTLGNKPFVLHIDIAAGGKLEGWNKTGNNKRPVSGTYEAGEPGSSMKYTITLREPGDDKWDGEFMLDLNSPMSNAAPTDLMGEWKSFKGGLRKVLEAEKQID